jgi:hypothetical protein
MYDSYKTAVGGQTRDVKTVDSGGSLDEERSARKEFGSRACSSGRFKNYFPITGTFFSCSFDKEFGSRMCSSARAGALQNYFPITGTFFNCSFDKEFGSRACSLGHFKNYFPITGALFNCSFDKEFGSRACSSGALQKVILLLPVLSLLTATTCLTVLLISNGFRPPKVSTDVATHRTSVASRREKGFSDVIYVGEYHV